MVVIVIGSLVTGIQTIHGPFHDMNHAIDWADDKINNDQKYEVVPLQRD